MVKKFLADLVDRKGGCSYESQLKDILLERLSRSPETARSALRTIEEKQLKSKHIEEYGKDGTLIKGFRVKTSSTTNTFPDISICYRCKRLAILQTKLDPEFLDALS